MKEQNALDSAIEIAKEYASAGSPQRNISVVLEEVYRKILELSNE